MGTCCYDEHHLGPPCGYLHAGIARESRQRTRNLTIRVAADPKPTESRVRSRTNASPKNQHTEVGYRFAATFSFTFPPASSLSTMSGEVKKGLDADSGGCH